MTPDQAEQLHTAGIITQHELNAILLDHKGLSQRAAALALGISRGTYRDRLKNAARKINTHRHKEPAA